ncbi:unnamed protein product [Caenorhabditis nigoni]|uniref:Uncharacterized protein n=1 Tax=Caenorhabditis nigoni TaxID=1611254 RepID=A0A2G5SWK7_9PELO|nr:hypothetical protein B9Z55_024835 [Caenorhabditis nigoni]
MIKIIYFVFTALATILMHFWCYGLLAADRETRSEQIAKRPDDNFFSFLLAMLAIDCFFNYAFACYGIREKKIKSSQLLSYMLFRAAIFVVILCLQKNSNLLIGQFVLDILATAVFHGFSKVHNENQSADEVEEEAGTVEKGKLIIDDKLLSEYAKVL